MAESRSLLAPQSRERTAEERLTSPSFSRQLPPLVTVARSSSFLFLQGVSSPFFAQLARRLRGEGHRVRSVTFNMGDLLYSHGRREACFSRQETLADFYARQFHQHAVTDLVLFGDQRPVHKPAIQLARSLGIRVHVFEEGYFRPYWITLERNGVNEQSQLPRDPQWYREVGKHLPNYGNGDPFKLSFTARALHDVAYHTGGLLNPLCFPRYRTHAPYNAAWEYAGFIRRSLRLKLHERRDTEIIARVADSPEPHFLLPLQLDSDAQIREHSPFNNMCEVLDLVMRSLALHAPTQTRLVVKNHPLSPGLVNYEKITAQLARRYGLDGRVDYLESGHMPTLLNHVRGVITVNSTVGGSSLHHGRPTFALSSPIYDLDGLTHQGELDTFWREPQRPDTRLYRRFRNTVIHTTQVNGGFYTRQSIAMAAERSVKAMLSVKSPLEELL